MASKLFHHLTLIEKLELLAAIRWPKKPIVKEIDLNDYSKDLFKESDIFYVGGYCDNQRAYKKATDLSGDTVYYFYNLEPNKAYRVTRSVLPVKDPAKFIFDFITSEDYQYGT